MAVEWEETVLADISSDISYGYTESATYEKVGPRFLRITDIQNGVVNWANVPYCPISPDNHQKYRLQQGDIVIARTGNSTGENFLYRGGEDAVFASYLIRFRIDRHKADPRFVWYNLRSRDWWDFINNSKTGSAQAGANAKILGLFTLNLPPLNEQRAIGHILGTLDDKIELNRRMNETLEAMARAMFKSWFVDFDPVRAKAEGRDPGLPKDIADLFPERFEDSELREIPAGWAVKHLVEVTEQITKGTTPTESDVSSAPISDVQINYLRVNALAEDGSILYDNLTKIPETVHRGVLKRSILRPKDVVYTIAGTIGRVALIEEDLLPANANQAIAIIRLKSGLIPPGFLVLTMRQQAFQEELHSNIVHAVQANLSLGMISRAKAVFPRLDSLETIFKPIEDLLQKVSANRKQSRILAGLRDTLLPKLISGELKVPRDVLQRIGAA